MANISIFSRRNIKNKIQALEIDATISETHEYSNLVTDYPVEDGFNVSDHVKQQPEILIMECIVTQTPFDGGDDNIKREDNSDRVLNYYNTLIGYAGYAPPKQPGVEPIKIAQPQLLDIVTGLKTWTGMVIERIPFSFNSRTGQAINFSVFFKKIRKVNAALKLVPNVSTLGTKAKNVDKQGTETQDAGVVSTTEVVPDSGLFNFVVAETESIKGDNR
jgi:hypothetical protein